ncbi:MAG TPA: helicase, partial [Streptosporangiaceae bacterium]|nr:helicase [Streptosporangiaceae bacterium]
MTSAANGLPRTLADDLRQRSDGDLEVLFRHRPDLLAPVPADMTALVARAGTRLSLIRALDRLDRFTLQVLDALTFAADPVDPAELQRLVPAPADDLAGAVRTLQEHALVWGPPDALHVVRAVREVIGTTPGGTGPVLATALAGCPPGRLQHLLGELGLPGTADPPSALARLRDTLGDPESLTRLLATAPPGANDLLDKVDAVGNGRVSRTDRVPSGHEPGTVLEWLLARGVLVALDAETVVLPAEVAVARRGGALYPRPQVTAPPGEVIAVGVPAVEAAGVGQVMTTVRLVEQVLAAWSADPPPVLRSGGGLGVRELRRAQLLLDVDPVQAAL